TNVISPEARGAPSSAIEPETGWRSRPSPGPPQPAAAIESPARIVSVRMSRPPIDGRGRAAVGPRGGGSELVCRDDLAAVARAEGPERGKGGAVLEEADRAVG